jgi:outer membrane protein assembly factor BamA
VKKLILLALTLASGPGELAAQLPSLFPAHHYLVDVWYPSVSFSGRSGFSAGGFYAIVHPLDFAAEDFRPPHMWSVSLNGSVATKGSKHLTLNGSFPAAVPGWRFKFEFTTRRKAQENYFGLGNNPDFDREDIPGDPDDFDWANRLSTRGRFEARRRLARNLWVLAGFHAEHWRISPISPTSQIGVDLVNGLDPRIGVGTSEFTGRIGIVYDSRNDEVAPRSGMLFETIIGAADASVFGDLTYHRTTVSASGYVPVGNRVVLAGRALAQNIAGDQAIGSFFLIESQIDNFTGIGGGRSHRAIPDNGLLGPGKLLFNFDIRYDLMPYPTFLPVTLVGWMDAGRVFHNEDFSVTLDGLKVGSGGGLFVQIGRSGILGLTVGGGPGGLTTNIHSRLTF